MTLQGNDDRQPRRLRAGPAARAGAEAAAAAAASERLLERIARGGARGRRIRRRWTRPSAPSTPPSPRAGWCAWPSRRRSRRRWSSSSPGASRRGSCAAPGRWMRCERELDEYFSGRRREFSLKLDWSLIGPFATRVLTHTSEIPYGSYSSYGEIAAEAGSPRGARAAGNALGSNPIPIVIPCHRVLHAGGGLGRLRRGPGAKALPARARGSDRALIPVIDMWAPIVPSAEVIAGLRAGFPDEQLRYLEVFTKQSISSEQFAAYAAGAGAQRRADHLRARAPPRIPASLISGFDERSTLRRDLRRQRGRRGPRPSGTRAASSRSRGSTSCAARRAWTSSTNWSRHAASVACRCGRS